MGPTRRAVLTSAAAAGLARGARAQSPSLSLRATPVARDLQNPWSFAFLPDGAMLVTERPGRVRLVRQAGAMTTIGGVPSVWARGQGGMLDVCLDPDFGSNRSLYLAYAATTPDGAATRVARARLVGDALVDVTTI
ncbi:MAG: PQQ-dependent sugar dehydrogenase, partial [Alphaproteobacteria bacterium]|nr:PQQ-dependent sugar dehydrogenase [Alphaproteobacteria bacterium]